MVPKIQKDISINFFNEICNRNVMQSFPSKKYTGSAVDLQNVSENYAENILNN